MTPSSRHDPRDAYSRLLAARRTALAEAIGRHIWFGNLRVATFLFALAVAYAAAVRDLFSEWWVVVPAAAFVASGAWLDRAVKARARLNLAVAFYERGLARLADRWAGTGGETGERFIDDAHLYARDLGIFGDASLFELLNGARTHVGEETLAGWLQRPAAPSVVRARQEAVKTLVERTDLREDLAVVGETARTGVYADQLAAWGEEPPRLDARSTPAWVWLLSAAGLVAAGGLVTWITAFIGLLQLDPNTEVALRAYGLTLVAVCAFVIRRLRARIDPVLEDVSKTAHGLGLLSGVVGRLEAERFAGGRLAELRAGLDVEGQPPSRRLARLNTLTALLDSREHFLVRLAGPLVLWDLHLAYAIEGWRRTSGPALRRWLAVVGEMEALLSLAGYAYEHPDDIFPDVLNESTPCFDGEGLGHPLLAERESVRNDVRLTGDLHVLVVSGSNMSGKSTLLRTVGVNAVLALAGAPVRARSLTLPKLTIGASIHIQDSLQAGVSRFYAEITRIGEIMRHAADDPPVLFLIDELLHGTNSHDRRIGAEAIVRGLVDRGAIGLVTTHDLALAQVAEALAPRAANVHFQDVLEDGRMRFDYQMHPGVVQKSNALALMRSVGLDV